MKRVDAGDFGGMAAGLFEGERNAERTLGTAALTGRATGAFAGSKIAPNAKERLVGGIIWNHKGREHPISIAALRAATGWSDREIKGIVEQLVVTHRMKIGGRRGDPGGYFLVVDLEDQAAAVRPLKGQTFAMWRRLRVLEEPHALREMAGQLAMSVEAEAVPEGAVEGQKE